MANAMKRAERSQRSHMRGKNFRQFAWNAQRKSEAKAQRKLSEIIAEQFRKNEEQKKENK